MTYNTTHPIFLPPLSQCVDYIIFIHLEENILLNECVYWGYHDVKSDDRIVVHKNSHDILSSKYYCWANRKTISNPTMNNMDNVSNTQIIVHK